MMSGHISDTGRLIQLSLQCFRRAYRKSNPSILMMQSAKDRTADNTSNCLGNARHRRIVCTKNLNPKVVVMKPAMDRA